MAYMNAGYPQTGYSRIPQEGNPRRTEGWALMEAARRLREAKSKDKKELSEAVRLNWRLWTIFQSSMLEPDCPWPPDLRSNILNLADFIDKRSVALLSKPEPEGVEVLVNINLQIGGGLLAEPPRAHDAVPATPPGRINQVL